MGGVILVARWAQDGAADPLDPCQRTAHPSGRPRPRRARCRDTPLLPVACRGLSPVYAPIGQARGLHCPRPRAVRTSASCTGQHWCTRSRALGAIHSPSPRRSAGRRRVRRLEAHLGCPGSDQRRTRSGTGRARRCSRRVWSQIRIANPGEATCGFQGVRAQC